MHRPTSLMKGDSTCRGQLAVLGDFWLLAFMEGVLREAANILLGQGRPCTTEGYLALNISNAEIRNPGLEP